MQALVFLRNSLKLPEQNDRNVALGNVQSMLFNSLAAYNNPLLFEDTNSAGKLRRKECAWAIDQTITMTYQLQNAHEVVSDRIEQLQDKIRQDSLDLINSSQSEDELEFIFPEIVRINNHDLTVLEVWKNQVNWTNSLSSEERKELLAADLVAAETVEIKEESLALAKPPEQSLYENLKTRSHFNALRDQLKIMVKPEIRQKYESYITQSAQNSPYKALAASNWQSVPDLTVVNLYWYFKDQEV